MSNPFYTVSVLPETRHVVEELIVMGAHETVPNTNWLGIVTRMVAPAGWILVGV